MEHGILLSGADNIDFMIHGVFKYSFFGHEVWITTTHVCVLIVMLLIIGFAIAANRQMAKAREVPEGFQNVVELIVEKLDAMVDTPMGKAAPKFYNYISSSTRSRRKSGKACVPRCPPGCRSGCPLT